MCDVCGTTFQVVCGEDVCGTCYGVALTTERLVTRRPVAPLPSYECCGKQYLLHRDDHHYCGKGG